MAQSSPEAKRAWKRRNQAAITAYREANRAANRVSSNAWYARNSEQANAAARAWQVANPDAVRAIKRAYHERHPDREKARQAAWRQANPEKIEAYREAHREELSTARAARHKANPDDSVRYAATRRARKLSAFVEDIDRQVVYDRDGGVCGICHEPVLRRGFEVDHIKPLSKGGEHSYANVQAAHMRCNRRKHDKESP